MRILRSLFFTLKLEIVAAAHLALPSPRWPFLRPMTTPYKLPSKDVVADIDTTAKMQGFGSEEGSLGCCRERIFVDFMTSDRQLKASREGLEQNSLQDLKDDTRCTTYR